MLLSNLYVAYGKWDNVARIRKTLKDDRSKRIPGCTSIEVDGIVHEFEAIKRLLDEYRHASDKSFVLYDMEDELKGVLCQHSEG